MRRLKITGVPATLSILFLYGAYKGCNHPLERREARPCKVLAKVSTGPGHKVSPHWILILESDTRRFDLNVSPTTYWEAQEGQILYFKLTERQMGNSDKSWMVFLAFGFLTIGIVSFLLTVAAICKAFD